MKKGWVLYFSQINDDALAQLRHQDKTVKVLARRFGLDFVQTDLKSYAKSFHKAKRSYTAQIYIPNFDATSSARKCEILTMYGIDNVEVLTDGWSTECSKG